jgi:hypothetical protein
MNSLGLAEECENNSLVHLIDKWLAQAKQSYINAARTEELPEDRPTGKDLIESRANQLVHCAEELKEVLPSLSASISKIPKKLK